MKSSDAKPPVTPERIMQFAWGYAPPLILEAAVRHRVFDVLDTGLRTVEQLSTETGASVRGLRAVLNASCTCCAPASKRPVERLNSKLLGQAREARRPRAEPVGRGDRQPIGQDQGKRRPARL